ncbi:MAG: TonB-dependent receptor [Gemmatimonadetes bacterium]|nr:TonB-dependent receptor [Gemmatimonadota bacterium]
MAWPGVVAAQEPDAGRLLLSGYVRSAENLEVIRGARIQVGGMDLLFESNRFGYYAIELPPGVYSITVSYIGYETRTESVSLETSRSIDFELPIRPLQLLELTAEVDREPPDIDPTSVEMSVIRLDVPQLSQVPVVLGEADPVRALTLFPGISTANDATTAINVRGGAADENLILLDDSQVFNPAHAIGLFSTFNPDAVGDVTLHKGAIPARYGGRLSSVLDIQQREGNSREFEGAATIGLLASRLSLQGPLFGGDGSWLVTGRRTYADLFLGLSSDPALQESAAYFYDLNAKTNVRYSATGQILLSGYFGRDRFKLSDVVSVGWGNSAGTLRWNQAFGSLFSHVTLAYSDYTYDLQNGFNANGVSVDSRIRNLSLKIEEDWQLSAGNALEFGLGLTNYEIEPANTGPSAGSFVVARDFDTKRALAPEAFIEHEIDLGRVTLRYGLRGSGFVRRGPETVFLYEDDRPVVYRPELGLYEPGVVRDSIEYDDGETIESFWSLEPRLSLRVGVGAVSSIKASYSRTRQYLRLVTNTNSPTPLDIWDPAGPYVEPYTADQWGLGFVRSFSNGAYGVSVEAYYKRLRDLVDYVDGADLILNERLETEILPGEGRGYGLEVLLRKNEGRIRGWASYTLASSEQRTPGLTEADPGINGGAWYPSPYDRTHDVSVTGIYGLSDSWTLGGNFVFATGLPTTFPVSRYQFGGLILGEFGPRNAERLPDYHRLDITLTKRFGRGELQFGVFNVYNRFNAQALAFRQSLDDRLITEAVETSVFGAVPSISYRWSF